MMIDMGMTFDHPLGGGDTLAHGTTTTHNGFDPIMLVIATASGCFFITVLVSCICCSRRPERRCGNAHPYSRRDTLPLEDLLSKPTLADPESFFSEAALDDKSPPYTIGYWTGNDDSSVAGMSQISDLSTNELMGSDPVQTQALLLERKSKSEKAKRSKNSQNQKLNNKLRSSAKEIRRQSDQILDHNAQDHTKIIINDTHMNRVREEDFLYKNNDYGRINEINNTSSKKANNKLKKTDNKESASTQRSLDVAVMAEDRVSSESFTSSARGSISHDMTTSVNVLRLPRGSIVPQTESWSGSLLGDSERSTLSDLKENPSSPITSPPVPFSKSSHAAAGEECQNMQSAAKSKENNAANKCSQEKAETFVVGQSSPRPQSADMRPHIQENQTSGLPLKSNQPTISNCNNTEQTNARIPERISVNLQIDFHFSDNDVCCGNQKRSYVVCSPVSVSQEMREVSSTRVDAITSSNSNKKHAIHESENTIPDNTTCAVMRTGKPTAEELHLCKAVDNANVHCMSPLALPCGGKTSSLSASAFDASNASVLRTNNKRLSTPIDFIANRGMPDIELQRIQKKRFTIADVADVEVILKDRKLVQFPFPNVVHYTLSKENTDMHLEKESSSRVIDDSQPGPSQSSPTGSSKDHRKCTSPLSHESHVSNDVQCSEQIQEQQENRVMSSHETQRQQDSFNIPSIHGKGVEVSESDIDKKKDVSCNETLTTKAEINMDDNSSKHDDAYVSNGENEIVGLVNGGNAGNSLNESIKDDNSLSKEETQYCIVCHHETSIEDNISVLTPLNASVQESDEENMLKLEEEPIAKDSSTAKVEVPFNKTEQAFMHYSTIPCLDNEVCIKEHGNDKFSSEDRCESLGKKTSSEEILKLQTTEIHKDVLLALQCTEKNEKRIEKHDYACKDGAQICNIDANARVLGNEGLSRFAQQEEKCKLSMNDVKAHEYTNKDGSEMCQIGTGLRSIENEGQASASKNENYGKLNKEAESNSHVTEVNTSIRTESENTVECKRFISNKNGTTSNMYTPCCDENKSTQNVHGQTVNSTQDKASHRIIDVDCNDNKDKVENDCQRNKTTCHVERTKRLEQLKERQTKQLPCVSPLKTDGSAELRRQSQEIFEARIGDAARRAESYETDDRTVPKVLERNACENASNTLPARIRDQKESGRDGHNDPSNDNDNQGETQLRGILRANRSFDMTFKEQDNLDMNFPSINSSLGSTINKGHENISPFVYVSNDIDVDEPALPAKSDSQEGLMSPTISITATDDKSNASDESDYDNPWDSLDEAVKRGSMRYNRRASRVDDGSDAKTLMLKSAEDLGRLLEDAERRRRIRQNAARSSCQIIETTPASPPPTFTRLSPFRHTVKGLVSHGSSKDLHDDAIKSHPLKSKKDRQRSKDDLSHGFSSGIDPNRAKTITGGERSKIYSPETKKRKGLLHRK